MEGIIMTNVAMVLDDLMASIAQVVPNKTAANNGSKVLDLDSVDWYSASPTQLKDAIRKAGDAEASRLAAEITELQKKQRAVYSVVAREALEAILVAQPLQDFTSTYAGQVLTFAEAAERAQVLYSTGVQNGNLEESVRKTLLDQGFVEYTVKGEPRLLQPEQRVELDALEEYFGIFKGVPTASRVALAALQESLGGQKTLAI
jgi:hypothetical protein